MKKKLIEGISPDRESVRKIWMIMRLITFLLFVSFVHVSASVYSQKTRVNLKLENATLQQVFQAIQSQSEFDFFYKNEQIPAETRVTIEYQNETIEEILTKVLNGTGLIFRVLDKDIVVSAKNPVENETQSQQQKSVSGKVADSTGAGLPGVSVVVKGTTTGVITDMDGKYTISKVPENATLQFSFVGMKAQEVAVGNKTNINVKLEEENIGIEEVIAVGYTTQKKKDLTGSVASVNIEELSKSGYSNVLQAVQGRMSGVNITQDGQPGDGRTQIRVRGITTINNNNPLYIIDGIPTQDLSTISPNDIESLQVLKDASSASIYGSRSAGGVVIVTTKQGKKGALNIDAGGSYGVQTLANKLDLLDATQWGQVYWSAGKNDGRQSMSHSAYTTGADGKPGIRKTPISTGNSLNQIYMLTDKGTDWYKEVYHNASNQQYFVNVSNGNEKGSFIFGLNYDKQNGLIKETYYDRISVRLNSNFDLTHWIKLGENASISRSNQVQIGSQQGQDGIPLDVIRQHPALPVYDVQGNFAGKISGFPDVRNMVSVLEKNKDNNTESWKILANGYLQANILDAFNSTKDKHDLILKTNFGLEYGNYLDRRFNARFTEGQYDIQTNQLFNKYGTGRTLTWTTTAVYNYTNGDHKFNALAGVETVRYDYQEFEASRLGFENEAPTFTYLNAGSSTGLGNAGTGTEWGLYSNFGRIDYSYKDKYLLSATVRYDKTSRFKDSGIFPAYSLGWRISEEPFFKSLVGEKSLIDYLKLRTSYGTQGNQTAGDFAILSTMGADKNHADYDFTGSNTGVNQGYVVLTRGNSNLKWETTTQFNSGFDLSILDSRVNASLDYYRKKTKDIILQSPQIFAVGEGANPFVNAADVSNNGFDFSLSYNETKKILNYSASFQLNTFRNKINSIPIEIAQVGNEGELYISTPYDFVRNAVGHPIGAFYGYVADGIFQTQAEVDSHAEQSGKGIGRIRYKDLNNDKTIDEKDRTFIGNPYPKVSMGLNLSAEYKGFSLSMFFFSSFGQDVYNGAVKWYTDFAQNGEFNHGLGLLNAWSPTNTNSTIPAPTLDNANKEDRPSSYFIEKASFAKLKSLRLGYNIPKKLTKTLVINLYGEVQNVFTISNYSGLDPEVPYASGQTNYPGIDSGVYPIPRTFKLGINIKL